MYQYRSPENATVILPNGIIVQRYRILSTQMIVFQAWEMQNSMGEHATITTFDGVWYGTIYSRCDDSTFAHLKGGSDERIAAVRAHYAAKAAEAYTAIIAAFPEAVDGKKVDGEIEIHFGE